MYRLQLSPCEAYHDVKIMETTVSPDSYISISSFRSDVMLFLKYAGLALFTVWTPTIYGRPALHSNVTAANSSKFTTTLGALIPPDFTIDRQFAIPYSYSPESCYINIIAALCDLSAGNFKSKTRPANYRTTRFQQPLVKVASLGEVQIPRRYVIWGLFLTAFWLRANQRFTLSFFALEYRGEEVAGIGLGGQATGEEKHTAVSLLGGDVPRNVRKLSVDFDFFGEMDFGKDAVYMTIIGAVTTTAPSDVNDRITDTWISFLKDEPCIVIVIPTPAARTAAPYLIYDDLNLLFAKMADFFADQGKYRPLSASIKVDGVEVANAALTSKIGGARLAHKAIA